MTTMEMIRDEDGMSQDSAKKIIKEYFSNNRLVAAMLLMKVDSKESDLKWKVNLESLKPKNNERGYTFKFDLGLRSDKENIYHLIADKGTPYEYGPKNWDFEVY